MIQKNIVSYANNIRLFFRFACRRLGIPGYGIHQIKLHEQKLIYIPIPKNACSSIKHALHQIEFDREFDYDYHEEWGYIDIHDYYKKRASAFTGKGTLGRDNRFLKFAIVRDPVKRIISCYRNRVVTLGDLYKTENEVRNRGLSLEPDINTFILKLEEYRDANKTIEHHSRPQYEFLGGSLDYLDRIFTIREMDQLIQMLREYKPDLEMKEEKSGGVSYGLKDLSPEALDKALTFYEKDYELLSDYFSKKRIKAQYEERS